MTELSENRKMTQTMAAIERRFKECQSNSVVITLEEFEAIGNYIIDLEDNLVRLNEKSKDPENRVFDGCPGCGGVADNGYDRSYPPMPYHCTKCHREGF